MSKTTIIDISTKKDLHEFTSQLSTEMEFPTILALQGELGSGKTTFSQSLLHLLGVIDTVKSPTFTLFQQYRGKDDIQITHLDLYRLKDSKDLEQIGFDELLESSDLTVIEWPELAREYIPQSAWWLQFKLEENDKRTIILTRP